MDTSINIPRFHFNNLVELTTVAEGNEQVLKEFCNTRTSESFARQRYPQRELISWLWVHLFNMQTLKRLRVDERYRTLFFNHSSFIHTGAVSECVARIGWVSTPPEPADAGMTRLARDWTARMTGFKRDYNNGSSDTRLLMHLQDANHSYNLILQRENQILHR